MSFLSNFFSQQVPFGLDISDASIEVAQLAKKGLSLQLTYHGQEALEEGIVEDGMILNPAALTEHIKRAMIQAKFLAGTKVIAALPESKVFICTTFLPLNLEGDELHQAVHRAAEEKIPFERSEVYDDWLVVNKSNNQQEIFYVASPKTLIDQLQQVLKAAGLELVALDLESLSTARSLVPKSDKDDAALIVDIGARSTTLSIVDHLGIRLSSSVPIAGNYFTKSIMDILKVGFLDAESIKQKQGLTQDNKEAEVALKEALDSLVEEISKALNYYEAQGSVRKVILAGGSSLLSGLVEYLTQKLNREVKIGNVCEAIVDCVGVAEKKSSVFLATVVGLGIRGVSAHPESNGINLIPHHRS